MSRFVFLLVLLASTSATADGEVFKIEATGFESCDHFERNRFTRRNNVDLWVRIDHSAQLTVSFTPAFAGEQSFQMSGRSYIRNRSWVDFVASALFVDGSWVAASGRVRIDRRTGLATKMKGTFVQDSAFFPGCFSSGPFRSGKRLN